jgi:formamidopyrimidine-DNA glycosylase
LVFYQQLGDVMPELPEVETLKNQLSGCIEGKIITAIEISDKRLIKTPSLAVFRKNLIGARLTKVSRRGKVLILEINNEKYKYLIFHLRISGWLVFSSEPQKHWRVSFSFGKSGNLQFCDSRVLGEIRLVQHLDQINVLKTMGPEVLELKTPEFVDCFKGKKNRIKPLLLDQSFLAGIGNIYAQEALFCSGINPEKTVDKISEPKLKELHQCLKDILKKAIAKKGTSADTYRQLDGTGGGYVPFLQVYGRQGQPCSKCQSPILKKSIGGRGTCFCARCQK